MSLPFEYLKTFSLKFKGIVPGESFLFVFAFYMALLTLSPFCIWFELRCLYILPRYHFWAEFCWRKKPISSDWTNSRNESTTFHLTTALPLRDKVIYKIRPALDPPIYLSYSLSFIWVKEKLAIFRQYSKQAFISLHLPEAKRTDPTFYLKLS